MLYDGDNPILRIVGIEHVRWGKGTFKVEPREHSVLTFRINGSVTINNDGKEYNIHTNDILYLPQHMGYTAEYTDTEVIVIHFVTMRDDSDIEIYTFQNGEQLFKLFLRAHVLWKKKEPGYAVYAMAQLYEILGTLLDSETKISQSKPFLEAISYINANFKNNDICVDKICAKVGMSATKFRQLFKKHYKKTPTEYILALRLEYARNLISGGTSIEQAAHESGFNDSKYFARVVKKYFQCTPRDFKTYGK